MGVFDMRRIISTMVLLMFFCLQVIPLAFADSTFFSVSDLYLEKVIDLSDRQNVEMSASGYNPDIYIISFDFTDGNQTIIAIDGDRCKVYYFFEDEELWNIAFFMITQFKAIESQLPTGKALQYELRFSETDKLFITSDTLNKNYSWIK